ncbi:uncharacterized protein LOC108681478 isoform X2 [Hyalella azteca]|uniref:Pro-corazonin n=1 Tax=Hyalella azteca TaxID=294128 RepID=A0A8B7PIL3_HYAAZ|nr:uncharacterized protein LOC108681478 isoform X2 [Hyalella azteca]
MRTLFAATLLVVVIVQLAEAQTFQYSRGWTNGKRSGDDPTKNGGGEDALVTAARSLRGNGRWPTDQQRLLQQSRSQSYKDIAMLTDKRPSGPADYYTDQ